MTDHLYEALGVPSAVVAESAAAGHSIQVTTVAYETWRSWPDRDEWREAGRDTTSQNVTLYRVVTSWRPDPSTYPGDCTCDHRDGLPPGLAEDCDPECTRCHGFCADWLSVQ